MAAREIIGEAKEMVRENALLHTGQVMEKIEASISEKGLDPAAVGSTPSIKRVIMHTNYKPHGAQDLGDSFANIVIPPDLQKAVSGEQFFLYDNEREASRMIIYASKSALDVSE